MDINIMQKLLVLSLLFFSSLAQASLVSVDVSLNVSQFNPGPFTKGSLMNISFDLDNTITPSATGTTNPYYTWFDALDNLQINVQDTQLGTLNFSATDGRYRQQSQGYLSGLIKPANSLGTIDPAPFENDLVSGTDPNSYDPFNLSRIYFDFRLNNAAKTNFDAAQIITHLTTSDFSYLRFTMEFDHPTAAYLNKCNINTGGYFNSVSFSGNSQAVPEPATLLLMSLGIISLGFSKKLQRKK